jgi:hypothetical protein
MRIANSSYPSMMEKFELYKKGNLPGEQSLLDKFETDDNSD